MFNDLPMDVNGFRRLAFTIAGCQVLSLLICGTAVFSKLLLGISVSAPTTQSSLTYILLLFAYLPYFVKASHKDSTYVLGYMKRMWKYFIISFMDVEANFMAVTAYSYTTLVSVQIIDCLTIPLTFFLSVWILKYRFFTSHYIGLVTCLIGTAIIFTSDALTTHDKASNMLFGDFLAAVAAFFYGFVNIFQEKFVKEHAGTEYLFSLGLFATVISAVQSFLLERDALVGLDYHNVKLRMFLLGFSLCLFLFYAFLPLALQECGTVNVNLNLQTSDFYSLLFGLFVFHDKFKSWYLLGWCIIVVATLIYGAHEPNVIKESQLTKIKPTSESELKQDIAFSIISEVS